MQIPPISLRHFKIAEYFQAKIDSFLDENLSVSPPTGLDEDPSPRIRVGVAITGNVITRGSSKEEEKSRSRSKPKASAQADSSPLLKRKGCKDKSKEVA